MIESNVFEKCMKQALYPHFGTHLTQTQRCFVRGKSILTNMPLENPYSTG